MCAVPIPRRMVPLDRFLDWAPNPPEGLADMLDGDCREYHFVAAGSPVGLIRIAEELELAIPVQTRLKIRSKIYG